MMTIRHIALAAFFALAWSVGLAGAQAPADQQPEVRPAVARPVLGSPFPDDYDEIEPSHWRLVELSMELPHGGHCDITLLRPEPWLALTGARVGGTLDLVMSETGVAGEAQVLAIEPCPAIAPPPQPGARPVTGRFVTTDMPVLELELEGVAEPIGTTASHPFWSLDRAEWVAAGDLELGEALRTLDGSATVASIASLPETETVYNLEVHKGHTFFVSEGRLWVHNRCGALKWSAERAEHVRLHNFNNKSKKLHGVFDNDGVLVAEEGWAMANMQGIQAVPDGARDIFDVPMGRPIGYEGGWNGSGQSLSTLRLVLEGDGVISAYPVRP